MGKPKRSLEDGKRERANIAKAANARERNIAQQYLNAGPSIGNLARAAYHWYKGEPMLGGQNESGLDLQTGDVPVPGMRNSNSIVSTAKTLKNVIKNIDDVYFEAIKKGDIKEVQRLRDLHFVKSANKTVAVENNKPIHMYHGTGKQFNYFDDSKIGSNYLDLGYYGKGHYFTPSREAAEGYANTYTTPKVYDTYLNIKNPKRMSLEDESMIGQPIKTHDSVIASEKDIPDYSEYVVKTGSQVKSAEPITYDDKRNIIPLSQRDNFNINDLRYVLLPFISGGVGYNLIRSKKSSGGSIHIAPSKRGTFTAAATKHGMGVQEFASRVLRNKEDFSTAMVKKANFARNASKWKH